MKEKIIALLERHHGGLASEAAEISQNVSAIASLSEVARETLVRQVHTLKGSSGSLGFMGVFKAAEGLEHALRDALATGFDDATTSKLTTLNTALSETISGVRVEDSSLLAKFG